MSQTSLFPTELASSYWQEDCRSAGTQEHPADQGAAPRPHLAAFPPHTAAKPPPFAAGPCAALCEWNTPAGTAARFPPAAPASTSPSLLGFTNSFARASEQPQRARLARRSPLPHRPNPTGLWGLRGLPKPPAAPPRLQPTLQTASSCTHGMLENPPLQHSKQKTNGKD